MKMPCGNFKDHDIEEIPSDYLLWVAENWSEKTPRDKAICVAADKEWQFRERNDCHIE